MSGFSENLAIWSCTSAVLFDIRPGLFRLLCAVEKTMFLLWGDSCITRLDMTLTFRGSFSFSYRFPKRLFWWSGVGVRLKSSACCSNCQKTIFLIDRKICFRQLSRDVKYKKVNSVNYDIEIDQIKMIMLPDILVWQREICVSCEMWIGWRYISYLISF